MATEVQSFESYNTGPCTLLKSFLPFYTPRITLYRFMTYNFFSRSAIGEQLIN